MECQQINPCISCKEALGYIVVTVFGRNYRANWMFCEVFSINYIHFFLFIFLTTHTGKWHEYEIFLSGRKDYSFITFTKTEGKCTKISRHVMMKVRSLNYFLITLIVIQKLSICRML